MKYIENEQLLDQIRKLQEYTDSQIQKIADQCGISFEEAEALQEEHDDYFTCGRSLSGFSRVSSNQSEFYNGGSL